MPDDAWAFRKELKNWDTRKSLSSTVSTNLLELLSIRFVTKSVNQFLAEFSVVHNRNFKTSAILTTASAGTADELLLGPVDGRIDHVADLGKAGLSYHRSWRYRRRRVRTVRRTHSTSVFRACSGSAWCSSSAAATRYRYWAGAHCWAAPSTQRRCTLPYASLNFGWKWKNVVFVVKIAW